MTTGDIVVRRLRGQWHRARGAVRAAMARAFTRATGYEIRGRRPPAAVATNSPAPAPAARRNPLAEPSMRRHTPASLAGLLKQRCAAGDRLVTSPTFILSSVRSGSTLVRVMLDSHSRIYSPHELHLRNIRVGMTSTYVERSMTELGLDARELKYLLWDRPLHRELTRRCKDIWVNNRRIHLALTLGLLAGRQIHLPASTPGSSRRFVGPSP